MRYSVGARGTDLDMKMRGHLARHYRREDYTIALRTSLPDCGAVLDTKKSAMSCATKTGTFAATVCKSHISGGVDETR